MGGRRVGEWEGGGWVGEGDCARLLGSRSGSANEKCKQEKKADLQFEQYIIYSRTRVGIIEHYVFTGGLFS